MDIPLLASWFMGFPQLFGFANWNSNQTLSRGCDIAPNSYYVSSKIFVISRCAAGSSMLYPFSGYSAFTICCAMSCRGVVSRTGAPAWLSVAHSAV